MKKSEVGELITAIASTDNRTIGRLDIDTWAAILPENIHLAEAMEAVVHHRRTSTEWLMPKHIIDTIATVRAERLRRAGTPPMPGDLTWQQEKDWRQLWCAKVKDGATPADAAIAASNAMHLPAELEATPAPAAERDRLITQLAESKAIPKPERPRRKRIAFVDEAVA